MGFPIKNIKKYSTFAKSCANLTELQKYITRLSLKYKEILYLLFFN